MFLSSALADSVPAAATSVFSPAAGGDASPLLSVAPLLFIFVVFYFLLIRPQQKKIKEHQAMSTGLRRGDKVVTAGGVIGIINKIEADDIVVLEVAPEVRIRVIKDTIANVLTKTVANDN